MNDIVVSPALRNSLSAIRQAQRELDGASLRLASGKKVNRAIDNPISFFKAASLQGRAADFDRIIDGINQSINTIKEGIIGSEGLEKLLDQAYAIADESRRLAEAGLPDPNVYQRGSPTVPTDLPTEILANAPVAYWRLNEGAGPTATNLGTGGAAINGTYTNGPSFGNAPLYINAGDPTVQFDGVNQSVTIPNSGLINTSNRNQRTIEVVFSADSTAGRQVIYEEGATVNSLGIYIDSGRLYLEGRDQGAWGPLNLSVPISPNQTYHAALVYDRTTTSVTAYVNGVAIAPPVNVPNNAFPSHSGAIAIGQMRGGMWFHDGSQGGDNHYFQGRISDVAIYNTALDAAEIQEHYDSLDLVGGLTFFNSQFERVMNEIDRLVVDAQIGGINLLDGDDMLTVLNEDGSHTLTTEGKNFDSRGLQVKRNDFNGVGEILQIMQSVNDSIKKVQGFARDLSTDLSILTNRRDFSSVLINTHKAGSDDLTLANLNEEGANLLALQTQQNLATTTLSLAGESQQAVLALFDN